MKNEFIREITKLWVQYLAFIRAENHRNREELSPGEDPIVCYPSMEGFMYYLTTIELEGEDVK